MNKTNFNLKSIALATLLAAGAVPLAHADLGSVKEYLGEWLADKAPKSKPIGYAPTTDAWTANGTARRDERFVDERDGQPRYTPQADIREKKASSAQRRVPDTSRPRPARDSQDGTCTNVSRVWEGAAALAARGAEEKAYAAYVRLLSSCNRESELLGTVHQAKMTLSPARMADLMDEPVLAAPRLQGALYAVKTQAFFNRNKAGQHKEALALGRELKSQAIEHKDGGVLEILAWLEHQSGQSAAAEKLFRVALKMNPERESLREGLAAVMLARSKPDAAWTVAQDLETDKSDQLKSAILAAQARNALADENFKEAAKLATNALALDSDNEDALAAKGWAVLNTGDTKKATIIFADLSSRDPDNKGYGQGLVASLSAGSNEAALKRLVKQGGSTGALAQEALGTNLEAQGRRYAAATVTGQHAESSSALGGTLTMRSKSGTAGEGKLQLAVAPEANLKLESENTTLTVNAGRLTADNGVTRATGTIGQLKIEHQLNTLAVRGGVTAVDIGQRHIGAEIGVRKWAENGFWDLELSRSLMTDSVRSMGGEADTGPASKTQIKLTTNYKLAPKMSLETTTGLGSISANSVAGNSFIEHDSALMFDVSRGGTYLAAGPALHFGTYSRDENRFDGAYRGGYYSPEADAGLGAKVRLATPEGQAWLIKGTGQALYSSRSFYTGSLTTLAVEGSAAGGLLLSDHLIGVAGLSVKTATGYNDVTGWLGVSVPFERRTKLFASDLKTPTLP